MCASYATASSVKADAQEDLLSALSPTYTRFHLIFNMSPIRATIRVLLVLWSSLEAAILFAWMRVHGRVSPRARAEWLHGVCRRTLRRVGVEVKTEGETPREGLIVANHLSYADILALSSIVPC